MIVKVCGITNQSDATAAIDGGADAIGFNFYPKSPRFVEPVRAAEIVTAAGVLRVGVFVNESPAQVEAAMRAARLDVAQLHGEETPAEWAGMSIWKAARVQAGFDLAAYDAWGAQALLLDGPSGELYGGSGRTFDWELARSSAQRIILAGGLNAANVAQAIAAARPWGVDACSRIESEPGRKDYKKMLDFIQAARKALQS